MKPFNLEAALAGAKVITRDGSEVTQLTLFDIVRDGYVLYGVLNSEIHSWLANGKYYRIDESNNDLFMAPVKIEQWVARYGNYLHLDCSYDTEAECKALHQLASGYHKIEWEEADETI